MTEYCSVCQKVQNVRVTLNDLEITKFWHCEKCNNFIRSENLVRKRQKEFEKGLDDKTEEKGLMY